MGDIQLSVSHRGPEGTVTAIDGDTGEAVMCYDYSDASLTVVPTIRQELIQPAMRLIFTYLDEMQRAQRIMGDGPAAASER